MSYPTKEELKKKLWYRLLRIFYIFSYIVIFVFAFIFSASSVVYNEPNTKPTLFFFMVLLGGQLGLYIIRKALLFIILGKEKSKEVGSWENTLKTKIKNLIVIHVFKPIKKYPRKSIALVAIILSLTISLYIWFKADAWVTLVATGDGWYYAPWMSRFEITYSYFVAFSKIALINIWIFTSAFLLLKVIPDNKIEGEK